MSASILPAAPVVLSPDGNAIPSGTSEPPCNADAVGHQSRTEGRRLTVISRFATSGGTKRAACVKSLPAGDTLFVWRLERPGGDRRHLVITVHDLTKRGGGPKVLTGEGVVTDTTTASGQLALGSSLSWSSSNAR